MAAITSKTRKLIIPVPMKDGALLTEVVVPRLKAAHLRRLGSDPTMGDILDILPDLCSLPKAVIDDLDGADAIAIAEFVGDFLDPGETGDGKTPSI
jgi:hypothetical protein